jgi:hypothetical protein
MLFKCKITSVGRKFDVGSRARLRVSRAARRQIICMKVAKPAGLLWYGKLSSTIVSNQSLRKEIAEFARSSPHAPTVAPRIVASESVVGNPHCGARHRRRPGWGVMSCARLRFPGPNAKTELHSTTLGNSGPAFSANSEECDRLLWSSRRDSGETTCAGPPKAWPWVMEEWFQACVLLVLLRLKGKCGWIVSMMMQTEMEMMGRWIKTSILNRPTATRHCT